MKNTRIGKRIYARLLAFTLSACFLPLRAGAETTVPEATAPGGDDITLALLIVSGLLAIASFIAFLISLSTIRNKTNNKGEQNEHHS